MPSRNEKRASRLSLIQSRLDPRSARILEIGALDSPTFERAEFNVKYLDYFTAEELRAELAGNPVRALDDIVDVDFTPKVVEFATSIDERFDLIVANHVIEHIPDVVTWIDQVNQLLTPGGMVFLSVPDRRYTFDHIRPLTTFVDLLRRYDERATMPSFYDILSAIYFHRPIKAAQAWNGEVEDALDKRRFSAGEAIRRAKRLAQRYTDVHCHIFEFESFHHLWRDLVEAELVSLEILEQQDVSVGTNEFHVLLGQDSKKI